MNTQTIELLYTASVYFTWIIALSVIVATIIMLAKHWTEQHSYTTIDFVVLYLKATIIFILNAVLQHQLLCEL